MKTVFVFIAVCFIALSCAVPVSTELLFTENQIKNSKKKKNLNECILHFAINLKRKMFLTFESETNKQTQITSQTFFPVEFQLDSLCFHRLRRSMNEKSAHPAVRLVTQKKLMNTGMCV